MAAIGAEGYFSVGNC